MSGFPPEELIQQSTRMLYVSQDAFEDFGSKAYSGFVAGKTAHTEIDLRRKDGSVLTVSITGGVIDKNDLSLGSIWILEDISERKAVQDRLRKLSQAVEQSPVSILITDLEGSIEFVNSVFTSLTGYAEEALLSKEMIITSNSE